MSGPLQGINVLDFGHTVMGPSCGLVLADLGATVVRIEPASGDPTRALKGFGAGFFAYFNRNKASVALDLKQPAAHAAALAGLRWADVLIENFAPGTIERLGLGYEAARAVNPRLIYCSLKGFLPGPYEHRPALDEVVQMMGGLAYMTGPPGQPMRAGASIIDITGGAFGAIGILAALRERERTGRGMLVQSALFESVAFLVGQHMAMAGISGEVPGPMATRRSPWAVYDVIDGADGQVFVSVTSDRQWQRFVEELGFADLAQDPRLATNNQRVDARPWLIPLLRERLGPMPSGEIAARCERANVAFAPIRTPIELFDDPHLAANGSLLPVESDGATTRLPALPLRVGGAPPAVRRQPPATGAETREFLALWGLAAEDIERLIESGAAGAAPR
jgi:crotonobetainyl-CoA:carnitine CoA-transferase CaiB-like acyl-CoA transferase